MGGKCCGSKAKKNSKIRPSSLNTDLQIDTQVLYSDSRYFKLHQQLYYNKLLMEEYQIPEHKAPEEWIRQEIIGQGSYGCVVKATTKSVNSVLAIKEIPLIGILNIKSVLDEVEIISQLHHNNIVKYQGYTTTKEFLLLFMEYISGGTLNNLISSHGKLCESLTKTYIFQVLKGLEYLHYHNIVHRDIKSSNVLVTCDGVCKLADFGSAKKIIGKELTSSVTGTFNWIAPEVFNQTGHGRHVDIWGIGCLVIEMATGRPPWSKLKQFDIIMKVCSQDDVPELPKEYSKDAKDFVSLCFKRIPYERPNIYELLQHPFITN